MLSVILKINKISVVFFWSQMLAALRGLVKNALYSGSTEPSDVVGLFPGRTVKGDTHGLGLVQAYIFVDFF